MINYSLIEKNKNKIINFGVIILVLIIALQFHRSANDRISLLVQQQNNELEKNKVIEDIAALEKKAEAYKKVFVKKDLASIMNVITGIAKDTSIKILSVKPYAEEALNNYLNSSFLITLNAPSYHALGDFISKIENNKDIYLVSEVTINSAVSNSEATGANADLEVSLKINTIAYL
ncbi:MAG: type 4a pilus biogenesis protein PilO [Candidatus Omnitrophica bacterium]|nr:type 4a pilus biogenesis protein PilO [Candidatus Omnitrophota bacterium]MBU4303539.1 type 4a pilus biogenesis protein PilO [Candidatus Omnitrophota bacterium]MBU4468398.1 type 4a pilus biogenesis protein PilO [Candidatus Omnitrophota bacterium]MCG2708391.1 type 4a pilus biogenesis protein PilO [Candidatus Omnitrophota bacterium]